MRVFDFASPAATHHASRRVLPEHEEILILTGGSGDFRVDDRFVTVGTGGLVWFYAGELLEAIAPEQAPFECVVILFHLPHAGGAPSQPRISQWPDPDQAVAFAREALSGFRTLPVPTPLFDIYLHTRLLWIASRQGRAFHPVPPAHPPALERALTFIRLHHREPITIWTIAKAAGISPARLHQLFLTHRQTTPKQAVIQLRLQHAKDLLSFTSLSVKEVAHASGFQQSVHFCRAFRKVTGQSPGEYRRHARTGEVAPG